MTKKLKNIILISMVFVFLTPTIVKLFDGLYHHHFHFSAAKQNSLYEYHDICPIPGFELSICLTQKLIHETRKIPFSVEFLINYASDFYFNDSNYSFSLRAPPCKQI